MLLELVVAMAELASHLPALANKFPLSLPGSLRRRAGNPSIAAWIGFPQNFFVADSVIKSRWFKAVFDFRSLASPASKIISETFPQAASWQASCKETALFNVPQTIYIGPQT